MGAFTRGYQLLTQLVRVGATELRRTRRVMVPPELEASGLPPIFILGVHRSGTTLLRLILDSHSRIACPTESFFLRPLAGMLGDDRGLEGLEAMGFDREHVIRRTRAYASYFFEAYAASHGKARWADKTPVYVNILDFLEALYGPECPYIVIYRHGLDTACSIADVAQVQDLAPHMEACGGDPYVAGARYWAHQCRKLIDFQKAHPDRTVEIRYEDLARDPEPHMRKVFDFIGEPWEPDVLRFHEKPHDRWGGLEDTKASRSKGFNPNIGGYLRRPPEQIGRMVEQAGPVLEELGYTVDAEAAGRTP